jgi:hypothetical protein
LAQFVAVWFIQRDDNADRHPSNNISHCAVTREHKSHDASLEKCYFQIGIALRQCEPGSVLCTASTLPRLLPSAPHPLLIIVTPRQMTRIIQRRWSQNNCELGKRHIKRGKRWKGQGGSAMANSLSMRSITENIYCSQLSSVAILLQAERNCFTSYSTRKGLGSL